MRSKTDSEPAYSNTPCKQIQPLTVEQNNKKLCYRKEHSAFACLVGVRYDICRDRICWNDSAGLHQLSVTAHGLLMIGWKLSNESVVERYVHERLTVLGGGSRGVSCSLTCVVTCSILSTLIVRRVLSQLANDHLLLLAQSCGTVFEMRLHLLHHWQCFGED